MPARRKQGNRVVSGRLVITGTRVVFEPAYLDMLFSGKHWNVPIGTVTGVQLIDRGMVGIAMTNRDRFALRTRETEEVFVVTDGPKVVGELRRLLGQA